MLFTYLIYYILKYIYILLSSLITIISFASTPFLFFYFFPPTHLAIINVSHLIENDNMSPPNPIPSHTCFSHLINFNNGRDTMI